MKTMHSLALPLVPLALVATLALRPAPQTADEPLPDGVAAKIGDEIITIDEYKDYLLQRYGAGPLDDLVLLRLFQREAARLGVALSEAEVAAEVQRFWDQYSIRFRGEPGAMERELAAAGFTPASYRAKMHADLRRDLLEQKVVLAAREISEDELRARFDREYGVGGVRVVVRHILFTKGRIRADLRARGVSDAEIDEARLEAELKAKALQTLARLRAGEDFVTLARLESHDVSVHQNAGVIPGYNYDRYGDEVAAAVQDAEVGTAFGPVPSPVGLHLLEVVSRTETALEDVRAELTEAMLAEPASWQERNELRLRLRREVPVRTFR